MKKLMLKYIKSRADKNSCPERHYANVEVGIYSSYINQRTKVGKKKKNIHRTEHVKQVYEENMIKYLGPLLPKNVYMYQSSGEFNLYYFLLCLTSSTGLVNMRQADAESFETMLLWDSISF